MHRGSLARMVNKTLVYVDARDKQLVTYILAKDEFVIIMEANSVIYFVTALSRFGEVFFHGKSCEIVA
jgi:hypothetical protein